MIMLVTDLEALYRRNKSLVKYVVKVRDVEKLNCMTDIHRGLRF